MLADAGIPLGNQTVLMRGVNDCAHVMKRLCHKLVAARVKPYYFYQCDPRRGARLISARAWPRASRSPRAWRGHTTASPWPTYIIDAIGGGGQDAGHAAIHDQPGARARSSCATTRA